MQGGRLCVVNTHFYSNKDHPDIKLWQAWQLVSAVESYALPQNLPVLLCGDLNSTPTSAVYDLLSNRAVHPGHPDLGANPGDIFPPADRLTHSLPLRSAYATITGDEPPFTNYTGGFVGCLDYMFYSDPLLRPLSVAKVHEEKDIKEYGRALPNTQFSSDHCLMMADMVLGGR